MKISKILAGVSAMAMAATMAISASAADKLSGSGVIWEGEASIKSWKSVDITEQASMPEKFEVGDLITIEGVKLDEAKEKVQVQLAVTQDKDFVVLEDRAENNSFDMVNGMVRIPLTSEAQAELLNSASALHVNGENVIIKKVTYTAKADIVRNVDIWEGDVDITAWSQDVSLGIPNLPEAEPGGKIVVKVTALTGEDTPQVQISGSDAGWSWFDIKNPETGEAYDVTGDTLEIVLTESAAQNLVDARKLVIKGCNVKITKVSYVAPNADDPIPDESTTDESTTDESTTDESTTDESVTDDSATDSDTPSDSTADSAKKDDTSKGGKSDTTKTTTTTSSSNDASPNTGAAAAAVAGIVLAGAAIVISKKR